MGVIKDIHELDKSSKYLLVSIICIMPFWYVSIWEFNPSLFHSESKYFLISLSFCLTLVLYLLNLLIQHFSILILKKLVDDSVDTSDPDLKLVGALSSILIMVLGILFCYMCKIEYDACNIHYSFIKFLIAIYGFIFFRILWAILSSIYAHYAKINKDKKAKINK